MKYTYEAININIMKDADIDIPATAVGVTIDRDWEHDYITIHYLMEKRDGVGE